MYAAGKPGLEVFDADEVHRCATAVADTIGGEHFDEIVVFAIEVGTAFVSDAVVIAEVARILPVIVATFFLAGPLMILGTYFQAIGDAGRAALLGLTKNYVFAIPMTFALAASVGEIGIWLAGPVSDLMMLALALACGYGCACPKR